MFKKSKGFTLIELLIVVAIIGILAALLIPNAMSALQKAKQKGTMKDIMTISTACMDYVTDNGVAPIVGAPCHGVYNTTDNFYHAMCPFYVKVLPAKDQWGNDFYVYSATNVEGQYGVTTTGTGTGGSGGDVLGVDDFIVASNGRNNIVSGPAYIANNPMQGFYTVNNMASFNNDLVTWNGSWIVGPITRAGGTT